MNNSGSTKLIAFIGTTDYAQIAFNDLRKLKEVKVIGHSCFDYYNFVCRKLRIKPKQFVYYFLSIYFLIRYCAFKKNVVFLFHGVNKLWMLNLPLIKIANKNFNTKTVGTFADTVDFCRYSVYSFKDKFDLLFSWDTENVKKYKVDYYPNLIYSKVDVRQNAEECDVFYCGEDGGRLQLLENVYKQLTAMGLKCDFYCARTEHAGEIINGIKHITPMPYTQYLSHIKKCKIILEIIKKGNSSHSLRVCEAVVYDKKLITNNPLVKDLPVYDSKQFFVFDNNLVFDESFLKSELSISNSYHDFFSPIRFIEYIYSKLELVTN